MLHNCATLWEVLDSKIKGLRATNATGPESLAYMQYTTARPAAAGFSVYVRTKGDYMEPDIQQVIETLDFRVFIKFDEDYGVFLATCIDTGATASGATQAEAEKLITEILENDFRHAIQTKSLESLFQTQAPYDAKVGWYEARAVSPEAERRVPLEISPAPEKRGVQPERKQPHLAIISRGTSSAA